MSMRRISATDALVAGAICLGIALRVWILTSSQGALDADEAVWGLMARHVLHGHISTFYWGQAYGGSQETLVTAAFFWLFGAGVTVLKVVPIVFWSGAALLIWRIGIRTLGEPRARLAAALFWMWPLFFVWKSTRAHGFYGAGLVFGLWALLSALRLSERPRPLDGAQLGLALGLGWWATPQVAILGLPAVLWLVWRRRDVARLVPVGLACFALGGAPWWIYNVRHHWASLHAGRDESSTIGHLHNLVSATLPTALGLRLPFSLSWLPDVAVGLPLYVFSLLGFAWLLLQRPPRLGPVLLAAALFPAFYAASPYTWLLTEPRYLTLVAPVIVLLLACAASTARRATAIFAVTGVLSIAGLAFMVRDDLAASHADGIALPASFRPLLHTLDEHGVHRIWASYWIAYRVTFESAERIVAAEPGSDRYRIRDGRVVPTGESNIGSQGRYAPFQIEVSRSRNPAHVFAVGERLERSARPLFRRAHYTLVTVDGFDVWLPPR